MKPVPNFAFEKELWKIGFNTIGGVDEVGRGSFAGPVIAGCVIFAKNSFKNKEEIPEINDSKLLSAKQRQIADKWIRENASAFGVGGASVSQINRLGIKKATEIAFRKAIKNTKTKLDFLIIDGFYAPYVTGLRRKNQKAIIKGDSKSLSIASASIIAKVYRDNLMISFSASNKFECYGWDKNKGYGTREHREAIKLYGISRLHRKLFVKDYPL